MRKLSLSHEIIKPEKVKKTKNTKFISLIILIFAFLAGYWGYVSSPPSPTTQISSLRIGFYTLLNQQYLNKRNVDQRDKRISYADDDAFLKNSTSSPFTNQEELKAIKEQLKQRFETIKRASPLDIINFTIQNESENGQLILTLEVRVNNNSANDEQAKNLLVSFAQNYIDELEEKNTQAHALHAQLAPSSIFVQGRQEDQMRNRRERIEAQIEIKKTNIETLNTQKQQAIEQEKVQSEIDNFGDYSIRPYDRAYEFAKEKLNEANAELSSIDEAVKKNEYDKISALDFDRETRSALFTLKDLIVQRRDLAQTYLSAHPKMIKINKDIGEAKTNFNKHYARWRKRQLVHIQDLKIKVSERRTALNEAEYSIGSSALSQDDILVISQQIVNTEREIDRLEKELEQLPIDENPFNEQPSSPNITQDLVYADLVGQPSLKSSGGQNLGFINALIYFISVLLIGKIITFILQKLGNPASREHKAGANHVDEADDQKFDLNEKQASSPNLSQNQNWGDGNQTMASHVEPSEPMRQELSKQRSSQNLQNAPSSGFQYEIGQLYHTLYKDQQEQSEPLNEPVANEDVSNTQTNEVEFISKEFEETKQNQDLSQEAKAPKTASNPSSIAEKYGEESLLYKLAQRVEELEKRNIQIDTDNPLANTTFQASTKNNPSFSSITQNLRSIPNSLSSPRVHAVQDTNFTGNRNSSISPYMDRPHNGFTQSQNANKNIELSNINTISQSHQHTRGFLKRYYEMMYVDKISVEGRFKHFQKSWSEMGISGIMFTSTTDFLTSIASIEFARHCARAGINTCIVDLCLTNDLISDHLGVKSENGAFEFLTQVANFNEIINIDQRNGLHMIVGGKQDLREMDILETKQMQNLCNFLEAQYQLVIYACPTMAKYTPTSSFVPLFGLSYFVAQAGQDMKIIQHHINTLKTISERQNSRVA